MKQTERTLINHLRELEALRERMDPNDPADAIAIPRIEQCITQAKDALRKEAQKPTLV